MFKDTASPKEPEVEAYGPDFFAYRKLYGDPPPVIETLKPIEQLWGFQEDIMRLASGRRPAMTETQIHDALRENGIYVQRSTPEELPQYEGLCRPLQSLKKGGEYVVKIATPEDYSRYYGVDLHRAQHMTWRDFGHEAGHGSDFLWCRRFFKNLMISLWGTEVRQWHFFLRYAQAVGDHDLLNQVNQFFRDIKQFGSVIKIQK